MIKGVILSLDMTISPVELYNDYELKLYYSAYYKRAFMKIYEANKDLIETIAKNIFKSYINSIPSYSDVITKLPNMSKLKNKIKELDSKKNKIY